MKTFARRCITLGSVNYRLLTPLSEAEAVLPYFDGFSYTILPINAPKTGIFHVRMALQAAGATGLIFYAEGQVSGTFLQLSIRKQELYICAKFEQKTKRPECAVEGEIVVG